MPTGNNFFVIHKNVIFIIFMKILIFYYCSNFDLILGNCWINKNKSILASRWLWHIVSSKFWAAFSAYCAVKSLCCQLIVNCGGVPDYGAENTLDVIFLTARGCALPCGEDAWRLGTAWSLALGVRVEPFCKFTEYSLLRMII